MDGIIITDENIRKVLEPNNKWYIPETGKFSKLYKDNINKILEAFYYSDITNTRLPDYMGFGSSTSYNRILRSFFIKDYYSKVNKLHSRNFIKSISKSVKSGTHNFLSKNLLLDNDGKSIIHKKIAKFCFDNGTHPWSNRKHNIIKSQLTNINRYGNKITFGYWNRTKINQNIDDIENYVSDGRIYEHNKIIHDKNVEVYYKYFIHTNSPAESITCNILSRLSLDYDRQIRINKRFYVYWVDFYIKDLDIYLEIDGSQHFKNGYKGTEYTDYDIMRERIIESILHKSLIRIPTWDIYYYKFHIKEFYKFITSYNKYPLIKI